VIGRWPASTGRAKLATHSGQIFALESGPLSASYAIGDDGSLAVAAAGAAPSLTLTVSPLALPVLAADPSRWRALVTGEGDPKLAKVVEELALTFPWFVERAFAAALGPIVGQKVADAGRTLLSIPAEISRAPRPASATSRASRTSSRRAPRLDALAQAPPTSTRAPRLAARVAKLDSGIEHRHRPKVT
jgi:ubiquinone biosynthesis protein UbiJ